MLNSPVGKECGVGGKKGSAASTQSISANIGGKRVEIVSVEG